MRAVITYQTSANIPRYSIKTVLPLYPKQRPNVGITYQTSTNIPRYSIKTVLRSYHQHGLLAVPFLCVKSERVSNTGRKGAGEMGLVLLFRQPRSQSLLPPAEVRKTAFYLSLLLQGKERRESLRTKLFATPSGHSRGNASNLRSKHLSGSKLLTTPRCNKVSLSSFSGFCVTPFASK